MGVMYLAFFNASVVLAALAALAYFMYTFSQYRMAQEAKNARRRGGKGARARAVAQPALVGAGSRLAIMRALRLVPGYVANQSAQMTATVQRVRGGGQSGAVAVPARSEFEVADSALPLSAEGAAFGRLGSILSWLLAFTLAMALLMRTLITGHAPWTNMYEASIALAEFLTLAYIYFELRYKTRTLGLGASALALILMITAVWVGAAFNQAEPVAFQKIMPALQDNPILTIHVSMMIVSYAFFIVGFICGVIMLVQGDGPQPRYAWLPTGEAADELGYRSVTIGFPLLALGIILGAWWANYAWGHYWSWDPKETSALITWLIYAIYLHARGLRGMRGKTMAWLLIGGFAATLFTYFGVSFIVPGLHSYAGVKS
jgi:cytochrome c-type biogenesis protein CcsB